jgi:DNA polymerase I
MMRRISQKYAPDYLCAVYESLGPTFREQEFPQYKANRTETPPDLTAQIPLVRRLLEAQRVPVIEYPGYEADDVIGTLSVQARAAGMEVVIVSSDKDMMQLVGDGVTQLNPMKDDQVYTPAEVKEFLGVYPEQVADLLALKGDAVDNIPGAPGIGDKGAKDLMEQFGSLRALLERAGEVQRKMYRESLQQNREQIELSLRLSTIERNLPITFDFALAAPQAPDREALSAVYRELEFFSFLEELEKTEGRAERSANWQSISKEAELQAVLQQGSPLSIAFSGGAFGLAVNDEAGYLVDPAMHERMVAVLADASIPKVTHDAKSMQHALQLPMAGLVDDVMLSGFLLHADPGSVGLETLCERWLHSRPGEGADRQACAIAALHAKLSSPIAARGLQKLLNDIDLPLADVLLKMEQTGVLLDLPMLATLSSSMEAEIQSLSTRIFDEAKHPFNINSPQQLGAVLFEELGLPAPPRSGKTKSWSTAADVLEGLAPAHPIAAMVLEYRQLSKLKGTYIDALPALVRPDTGRIHTTFHQTGAATGRLSSSDPNLQNIPIRTTQGREIRAAFIPQPGWTMVCADYSQIELRLLAHLSEDPLLVDSFRRNEDIHARTASEVFNVSLLMVSPEMRRDAKAVNFGIVYGQTSFGLASQLGISRGEADQYIRSYFARYQGVKKWIDATIAEVRGSGVSRSVYGRERIIPDIDSRNPNARGFAERTAVNTPLQGAAADLIKVAMIRIDKRLRGMQARMLLQVHDELVFEAPAEEVAALQALVKEEMEGAHQLIVPLVAESGIGPNWRDAK